MMKCLRRYLYGIGIALDQLANAILAGYPDETVSTRAALARKRGERWGCVLCKLLDRIDKDHCYRSLRAKAVSVLRRHGRRKD
jgi:hypothetical protein